MAQVGFAVVVVHNAHAHGQLDIGQRRLRIGFQEALRLGHIRSHPAGALVAPFKDGADDLHHAAQRHAQRGLLARCAVNQHRGHMVLQILAHALEHVHGRDAMLLQMRLRPDAREHQQLR